MLSYDHRTLLHADRIAVDEVPIASGWARLTARPRSLPCCARTLDLRTSRSASPRCGSANLASIDCNTLHRRRMPLPAPDDGVLDPAASADVFSSLHGAGELQAAAPKPVGVAFDISSKPRWRAFVLAVSIGCCASLHCCSVMSVVPADSREIGSERERADRLRSRS